MFVILTLNFYTPLLTMKNITGAYKIYDSKIIVFAKSVSNIGEKNEVHT